MGTARDEFLRRYATSPIHVPRLERFLHEYEDDDEGDTFSRKFIGWDRACRDAEAARIVTEVVSASLDGSGPSTGSGPSRATSRDGRIVRLSDNAMRGAIRWMAEATAHPVAERARILGDALSSPDETARRRFIEFLETSSALEEEEFRVAAHLW
jgi:hypothetical protein